MFWQNLHCACAETAISELLVKILTLPLDSSNPISYMV